MDLVVKTPFGLGGRIGGKYGTGEVRVANGEAAYQGFKMLFHGVEEGYLTCVKGHVSGWEAMRMGKKVKASEDWKKIEDGVMREIVRSKWEQSERVRQAIGESGERKLD